MSTGVVIGRFQIDNLHKGHNTLIETAIKNNTQVIIFIGSNPVKSIGNPLNFEVRRLMISELYPTVEIHKLNDIGDDAKWTKSVDALIDSLKVNDDVVLYGGRDSCIDCYIRNNGKYRTQEITNYQEYSATKTREEISKVIINHPFFRAGMIHQQYQMYPTAYGTVDIVVTRLKDNQIEILLGQKHIETDTNQWRFPGGFIDPDDINGKVASARELYEETGLDIDSKAFTIIDQVQIKDWRYGKTEHSIMTSIYTTRLPEESNDVFKNIEAKAGDDLAKIKWFKLDELLENTDLVRPLHLVCLQTYLDYAQINKNVTKK